MLTVYFPAQAFATNCYVLATGAGQECVVVDPGIGVMPQLQEVLTAYDLKPTAVLLTHGHVDHVYSVTPVCGGTSGAYIHEDDRYRLGDPLGSLDPGMLAMFEQQFGQKASWKEPEQIVSISDAQKLSLAGLDFTVSHAPGHTEGSVMFGIDTVPDGLPGDVDVQSTVLSGDVLFAGSIGRTDLPGGSNEAMQKSLKDVVLPLPDATLVLPGHGPGTTMAHERVSNPFLQNL
ncbi:MBL fold metallo-hydrolase [Yimella sp. cx-573]|nr:MBL fold metallo-hydrolase [Yimella sp. cx-573]